MSSRWCTCRWRPGPPDGAAEWCSSVLLRDTVPSWHRELSPPTTCCQLSAVGTQTLLSFTTHFTDAGCQAGPSIRKPSLKVTPTILETFSSCDHELCQRRILSIKCMVWFHHECWGLHQIGSAEFPVDGSPAPSFSVRSRCTYVRQCTGQSSSAWGVRRPWRSSTLPKLAQTLGSSSHYLATPDLFRLWFVS